MAIVRRVGGFTPKASGLHFANAWPHDPIRQFKLGNVATLTIGDAANGLCGGMSFAVRDLFEHGIIPPPDTTPPPPGSARQRYVIDRQIDSFENGLVPWRFYTLMDPKRPVTEPLIAEWLGRIGVDRHSRTYVMVAEGLPPIRADI